MSSPSPPPTSPTVEKVREFCVRLEAGHDVESEATRFVQDLYADLQANPDLNDELNALLDLLAGRLYTRFTNSYLQEATRADDEASWWSFLEESSNFELIWFLLQTLPQRVYKLSLALREKNRQNTNNFTLLATFFPNVSLRKVRYLPFNPLLQLRNECAAHRIALEALRDNAAERLGGLTSLRLTYDQSRFTSSLPAFFTITNGRFAHWNSNSQSKNVDFLPGCQTPSQTLRTLDYLSQDLMVQKSNFVSLLTPHLKPSPLTLMWPKLVLVPSITFILFRTIYTPGASNISTYSALKTTFIQIQSTAVGFWENYLLKPLRDILDTMRTGGSESLQLVNPQGVQADIESLHRMAISLAQDTYRVPSEARQVHTPILDELTTQITSGDLTPVLKIYEHDLRSPLRSALTGSLIRSLLIQVQRMKVDLSTTLQSLDKLLHSQALTFALVGVAPSLVITYALLSALRTFITGVNHRARYGGTAKRREVWSIMRRIERILLYSETIAHPASPGSQNDLATTFNQPNNLPALSQGLLLISLSHLRTFAHRYLPSHSSSGTKSHTKAQSAPGDSKFGPTSHIQKHSHRAEQNACAAFLSDIDDLSNPALGRDAKLRVVDRIWRSWEWMKFDG